MAPRQRAQPLRPPPGDPGQGRPDPGRRPHGPLGRHRRRHRAPGQEPGGGAAVPARSALCRWSAARSSRSRAIWCSSPSRYGFKAQIVRPLGKSNVLNDVMEALLADSGIVQRGFSPRGAGRGGEGGRTPRRSATPTGSDLRDLFTFTVDPDDGPGFRRRALLRAHARRDHHGLRPHRRRLLLRGRGHGPRPGGAPPRQLGLRGHRRGAHAAPAAVVRRLLAAARRGSQDGHRGDGGRRRGQRAARARFYRSLIRSDRRLDYEQLERMFRGDGADGRRAGRAAGAGGGTWPRRLREIRQRARQPADRSPRSRSSSGTRTARSIAADPGEELESHWFIENYMVLANEQVASFLEREQVPTVYRVHDLPDPFRVDHLLDVLSSLGLPTPRVRPHDGHPAGHPPGDARDGRVGRPVHAAAGAGKAALVQQVLRAQARAVYQTVNIGHFGLASSTYCHFTSPIRRYPDLLVHRALLGATGAGPGSRPPPSWPTGPSTAPRPSARPPRSN